jgi:serine/threonine protein kinase
MFRIVEDDAPPLPEGCSDLLEDFLRQCFHKEPSKRPTAEALCEHEWLKQNWVAGKELRQQDSIPFLRRVSTDLQKAPAIARYLAQVDVTPRSDGGSSDEGNKPQMKRNSNATSAGRSPFMDNESIMGPREHSFVKTAFGKREYHRLFTTKGILTTCAAMTCRVCTQSVKKGAVICAECSLIAHQKCAPCAPLTCDLRAQFLLYAESNNGFAQAADYFAAVQARSVGSSPPTESCIPSPRTSFDIQQSSSAATSPSPHLHPPTAFKSMSPFKRSRSSLSTPEPAAPTPPPAANDDKADRPRRRSLLKRSHASQERPISIASTSTSQTPNTASMRSALTAAESFSSLHGRASVLTTTDAELGRVSQLSAGENARSRSSRMTAASSAEHGDSRDGVPGAMPPHGLRKREKSSNGNCLLQ